jgi:hypothetical protein
MGGHWPAPWTWDGTFPIRILDFEGHIVCGDIMPSGEANARLIAAAPDLLEAAQRVKKYAVDLHGNHCIYGVDFQVLLAAIAKAESP